MRHRVDHRKLGRTAAHRKAMLNNMVTSLFASERIRTTDAKAKEARRLAERLITRAKKGNAAQQEGKKDVALAHWRQAARYVRKTSVLRKLFEEIAPHYSERNGGYTRIVRLGTRPGDNARQVLLELVDTTTTMRPVGHDEKEGEGKSEKKGSGKVKAKAKAKGKSRGKTKAKSKSKSGGKTKAKSKSKSKAKAKSKSKATSGSKSKSKSRKTKTKSKG
jgi:large subunit ribosomal protein L17